MLFGAKTFSFRRILCHYHIYFQYQVHFVQEFYCIPFLIVSVNFYLAI